MSTLEHSEHISHAGHGDDHDHGGKPSFGMAVGITMAILGVLLAFAAAKVGGERADLVMTLVNQQNAHAKYQGNDVKHRVATIALFNAHAVGVAAVNKDDIGFLAQNVQRYLMESDAAKVWMESYDPLIEVHVEAQEYYEYGQLAAEVGIVLASVALLLKRREPWFVALALGAVSIGIIGFTYWNTARIVHHGEVVIEHNAKIFSDMRGAHKTTATEANMVKEVLAWSGKPALEPWPEAPIHPEHSAIKQQ